MDGLINVADFEREALSRLSPGALGYFAGGAGDEETLAENVAAWRDWRLLPRVLTGAGSPAATVELLGAPTSPVIVAPVAYQGLVHTEAEAATASGAAAAGSVMCLSTLATRRPSQVAEAAPGGRRWFQLYCFRDAAVTDALVAEAVDVGFEAIVVTVDAPPGGNRERDLRSGFEIPEATPVPSVTAALGSERAVTIAETFALMETGLDWERVGQLAAGSPVPVIVKGVLAAEDAALAVEHGIAAVIVSNHGGRQLDRSLATAHALPAVVDAVGGRIPVLVDGGIRRGIDIAVALALGADAVLVGRAPIWGLAAAGAEGVRRVLELLVTELELALALCGVERPEGLSRAHLRPPGPARDRPGQP